MFRGKLSLLMQLPKNKTHRLPVYRQIDNHNNKHLIKQTDAFATFIKFKSGLVWIKSGGGRGQGFLWQNRTSEHQWINVLNATSSQLWSVEETGWFQSWLSGLSVLYYYFVFFFVFCFAFSYTLCRDVQSWVKITPGQFEIWIQNIKADRTTGNMDPCVEKIPQKRFWTKEKTWLKFAPRLTLIGLQTTGP